MAILPNAGVVNASSLQIAGVTITSNSTELNQRCDDSLMFEDIKTSGSELSLTRVESHLSLPGVGSVTLAAPTKPGFDKIISCKSFGGNVTLSLVNVVGGTNITTCTFTGTNSILILKSCIGINKWAVIREINVTMT